MSGQDNSGIPPQPKHTCSSWFNPIEMKTQETSVTSRGDETVTNGEFGLKDVKNWSACVGYQEGNHNIRHYSESRDITFTLPE